MLQDFATSLRPAIVMTLFFSLLLGLVYPAAMTAAAHLLFASQADGSLVSRDGEIVGSKLIGQAFAGAKYFHGRPSAAGKGYDDTASSGSNLGPTSRTLIDRVKGDLTALKVQGSDVPPDLVTTSASGLDPDISPEAGFFQVHRVAVSRGLPDAPVRRLVADHVELPLLGFIGEPHINVLALNIALDSYQPFRPK